MTDRFSHSVTDWIEQIKSGEDQAAQKLWDRYFDRLVVLARRKLGRTLQRVDDEEDLAARVFFALCEGAAAGRFDKLQNRADLWSLLVAITSKKAVDRLRRQGTQKRGAGDVRGHSVFMQEDGSLQGFEQVISEAPAPDVLAQIAEQHQMLLRLLRDDLQRNIVDYRLAGYSNAEIAAKTGISLRSVERKLSVIRDTWTKELST